MRSNAVLLTTAAAAVFAVFSGTARAVELDVAINANGQLEFSRSDHALIRHIAVKGADCQAMAKGGWATAVTTEPGKSTVVYGEPLGEGWFRKPAPLQTGVRYVAWSGARKAPRSSSLRSS